MKWVLTVGSDWLPITDGIYVYTRGAEIDFFHSKALCTRRGEELADSFATSIYG